MPSFTSKLDYCNAILYGLSKSQLDELQRVQNTAARLVTRSKKHEHITPVLRNLHWLPVHKRISFKILLMTFKTLNGQSPVYISELISRYQPTRTLRSCSCNYLSLTKCSTNSRGDRSFSVASAKLWNSLPLQLRNCKSVSTFKSQLKPYLFNL